MATKELMRQLSLRLEPARQQFVQREHDWALTLIHSQIPDDLSLFWQLPSHLVKNLQKVLGPSRENRIRFFLEYQSRHEHRKSAGRTVPVSAEPILKRCSSPNETDVRKYGLTPFPSSEKLNRRALLVAIRQYVDPVFGSKLDRDPNDPGEWVYRSTFEPWEILTIFNFRGTPWQVELNHDIRLGMGDLALRRQVSLHGVLGIGAGWNMAVPGDEESVGILASEYCRFFLAALPELLNGLDPGISRSEVQRTEDEWRLWLEEMQRVRGTAGKNHRSEE